MENKHGTLTADLTCTVCSKIFTDPCTLDCGHSFCMDCIKGWATMQSSGNRHTSRMGQFSCPYCKRTFPRCLLEAMKINIVLRNLSLDHRKHVKELESGRYSESLHGDGLVGSGTDPGDFCNAHPTEEASFVCLTCQVVFCCICSVIEKLHTTESHEVVDKKDADEALMDVLRERRSRLQELQNKVAQVNETISLKKSDLALLEQEINKISVQLKAKFEQVINDCREECVQEIEKKRDEYVKLLSKDCGALETDLLRLTLETEKDFQGARIGEMLKFLSHFITESTKLNQEFQAMQIRESMPDSKLKVNQSGFDKEKMAYFLSDTFALLEEKPDGELQGAACISKKQASKISTSASGKLVVKKGKQSSSDGIVEKGLSEGKRVPGGKVQTPNAKPKSIVQGNKVYPVSMGKFEAGEDYNLCDVAWLASHIAVASIKDYKIYAMDTSNGKVNLLVDCVDLQGYPVVGLSATMDDRDIIAVVAVLSHKAARCHMVLKGAKDNLTKSGAKTWNFVKFLNMFNCTDAKIFFDVLCVTFSDGKILVGNANNMKWNLEHNYRVSGCPEYIAVGRSGNTSRLYVKSEGNIVESFKINDQECTPTRYDTSEFKDLRCLAPDRQGNLWLADKSRKLLVHFSGDGCLQRYYHLVINGEIVSMNVSIHNIRILVKQGRWAIVYKIPLQSFGNLCSLTSL